MKKICIFLLVMTMGFSLMACGKKAGADANTDEVATVMEIPGAEQIEDLGKDAENDDAANKDAQDAEAGKDESVDEVKKSDDASKDNGAAENSAEAAGDNSSKDSSVEGKSADSASKDAVTADTSTDAAPQDSSVAEKSAEQAPAQAAAEATQEPPKAPQTVGYGRIIFTGDSRTVDMFSADVDEIYGGVYNNIPVFCRDGCKFQYMVDAINSYGLDNFDTLVTWMGCNDFGNFSQYGPYYDQLLAAGKQIVVCTVGPTQDEYLLDDMDWYYYPNSNQINYNNALVSWANSRGVKVIDMYSYINNSSTVTVNQQDGIHYDPKPTTELWNYIIANLK